MLKYKLLNDKSREIFYGDIYSVTKIAITSIYITHNLFAKKHNYKSDHLPSLLLQYHIDAVFLNDNQ